MWMHDMVGNYVENLMVDSSRWAWPVLLSISNVENLMVDSSRWAWPVLLSAISRRTGHAHLGLHSYVIVCWL